MHLIAHKLWVGSKADFDDIDACGTSWHVVHAARDPWHREALGYTGRGAPKDHPEYLWARRGRRLMLNLVDAADPKYIGVELVDEAMRFIDEALGECAPKDCPDAVLICCNQGQSRGPTIGMLYLAPGLSAVFEEAEEAYRLLCPSYAPGDGMRSFAHANWVLYRGRLQHLAEMGVREDERKINC